MCVEGEQGYVTRVVLPGESLQTSHSSHSMCLPVELPDEFEKSSERKFDFSFGAHEDSELSITASVSRMESLEADDSAGAEPPGASFQSEADAEMAAMFTQPAESIGLSGLPHLRPACHGLPAGLPSKVVERFA